MSLHWKELLPVDQYVAAQPEAIDYRHLEILTSLYQPLIGPLACQLYTTLFFESQKQGERSHNHLMLQTACTLETLLRERKKLEAMGLLTVFKKKTDESSLFIYQLKRPLEPDVFFADGVLNIYLFNRLGRHEYMRLKQQFNSSMPIQEDEYEEVTASFNEIYASLRPSELKNLHNEVENSLPLKEPQSSKPKLSVSFDFDELYLHLSDCIISKESFTEPVKEVIVQLSFVYQIGPQAMAHIIQQSFLHNDEIDIPALRKAVRHYYQLENGNQLPMLSLRVPKMDKKPNREEDEQLTEYEAQVRLFESLSPYDLLRHLAGGAEPVQSDLRIVEGLLIDQKLPAGVINVLLDYTMLVNDKKLIKSYIEKIASHWTRKKIQTVRDAMALAKSEHKKYQDWKKQSSTRSTRGTSRSRTTNGHQEVIPQWMKETKSSEAPVKTNSSKNTLSEEEEKWLDDYLKSL
ncbi:DnaD domain protein [Pullulanibacillus sp. KACC 23026]|uniref:replication initiation and membrane attachment family protein n=1 Tax=Pullulanibacillus sp. KACC 23026 TaxID=3028315 RepID=UPI0023B2050D|nr:DnaD domain protein [Pullulanibacillus sp. KACC 23026]WEG13914.1 DnaD domain protein [Pullulanibacillus sp. KACC 23026]